jgi:hypothetical protein
MIDPNLLLNIGDQDSLVALLHAPEERGGLGWPVADEEPFQVEPEIAAGVKGDGRVAVSRLIPASADEQRLILLAEFDRLYVRRDLRELLGSVRRHIRETGRFEDNTGVGDTVFIVAAPGYEDVRFVLFEERERRLPRIRSFGWKGADVGRTVLEYNLGRLLWSDREKWENAWDVEGLTDSFYTEFVKVFDAVKAATEHPGGEKKRHEYTLQLLNRLLFIAYIERMGWLKTPDGSTDYLHTQWLRFLEPDRYSDVQHKSIVPATFIGLLGWLFFRALDSPEGVGPLNALHPILGTVPYLNGGLFSEEEDLDVAGVTVADEVFDLILGDKRPGFDGGLFRRFNFTVTESTPLDQEVAVDPEMLGKIFERIIIAEERHRTGTYYTPRPIVEFMVNEALKGYLTERGLPADKAALLVDLDKVESDALSFRPGEMQDALEWLFEVRAVDPACGSGAYLLMLLQRLFELVDRLEVVRDKRRSPNQKHHYETKLRLLQRCIYGVDISEVAVRIARLRLWLSLVVENKGEKPEPLPSFDFLIMCGDSLASPLFPAQGVLGYPHDAIREYTRMKRDYFHPESGRPRPTRAEMTAQREKIEAAFGDELSNSRLRRLAAKPFDWEVEFAEVFDPAESEETVAGRLNLGPASGRVGQGELPTSAGRPPGFDIVLANPPYVNSGELLRSVGAEYKGALVSAYSESCSGSTDLLVFFLSRSLALLRPSGHLAFITSNAWLKAAYGAKIRDHIRRTSTLCHLVDFGELRVFQGVATFPLIMVLNKGVACNTARFTRVRSLESPFPDVSEVVRRSGRSVTREELALAETIDVGGVKASTELRCAVQRLSDYCAGRLHYGVKSGLEAAFVIDSRTRLQLIDACEGADRFIKPYVVGDDVRRWKIRNRDRYIIYADDALPISEVPAIMQHLSQFRPALEQRAETREGKRPWYALQRPRPTYAAAFSEHKIVFPDIAKESRFAFDESGAYLGNTCYFIPMQDYYLLGVLNSRTVWEYCRTNLAVLGNPESGGRLRFFTQFVEEVPIAIPSDADRKAISEIVKCLVTDGGDGISDLEAEIDRRVEFLYFHADEAPTYDEWVAKQEAERGTAVEAIRQLIAEGESGKLEFKQSLEFVDPACFANVPEAQRGHKMGESRKAVVHSALKTICAFRNSGGGTLLLGVHDSGAVIGVEPDFTLCGAKPNRDGFELKLTDLFKTRLRPIPTDLRVVFVPIDGKTVCRIDVPADPRACYLDNRLYVRLGNSTEELTGRDLEDWLRRAAV